MPLPSLTVNGQDVESLGFRVETLDGPWDIPDITDATVTIPGLAGAPSVGAQTQVAARTITVTGVIVKPDFPRTNADLVARIDTLKALFALGIVEVTLANMPTRMYTTRLTGFRIGWNGPAFQAVSAELTVTLVCRDPVAYETQPTAFGFAGVRTQVSIGNAPSANVLIRIMGPATNPVVTLRNLAGDVVHSIGLTRALLLTDYEEIDVGLMKVTRYVSGTPSNDATAVTSGDIESFVISPEDGDPFLSLGPTIECSGLSTNGNCVLMQQRGFL